MLFHAENEAEVSGSSSPSGGEFLSPSAENGASREIRIQEHDDSSDFSQNITSSAMEIEEFEAAIEQKESDHMDVSGSVANEPSSDEENEVEGDSKPLISNNMSDSLEQEQSGEEESEVNENNVAEEYFSNEEEDEVNGHTEPLTSKSESGSFAEEQSSEDEDGSNIYSVAKDHSSNEEDVDNEESEPMTSNNVTGVVKEEHSAKEEHGDHEETEPLTSLNISKEEPSLEHSDKDSLKVTETRNTSNGSPELKHSASVESFVSISSDIEGESLVEVLKQQLEHGRKSLRDLNKEFEEERNASAIATNQAMAMITRLQEEKAALHMEALQYLRMMDEQAEHDMDTLERANDVLADREKEIQDLEMELEYYRVKYPDEPREEILASMGILGNTEETNVTSPTDETSIKDSTDTKLTGSPSAEN